MSVTGNSSIYVGDLAEEVAEEHLWQVFSQAGEIVSVRRCRDALPNKRLNYGYVNYATAEDAQRAVAMLNHVHICNKPVRVMLSQRDGSQRRSGIGNIFVKNLHPLLVTNKVLYDHFQQIGVVLSAKVATDQQGLSKKYGFVQFEDAESADRAINTLHQSELCGQRLVVTKFISARDRASEPGTHCNVYVKGLGSVADEDILRSAFSRFGPISSIAIMRNSQMKSRGFGFVNFENADDAARAVAEMDGYSHEGQIWKVHRAQKRNDGFAKERLHQTYVQVKNLAPTFTVERLRSAFEGYGPLENAEIILDSEGSATGTAIVRFQNSEDAEAAITGLNNHREEDHPLPWTVSLAPRRAHGPLNTGRRSVPQTELSLSSWRGSPAPFLQHPHPMMTPNFNFFEGPQFFYQPTFLGQQTGQQQVPARYLPIGPQQLSSQPVYDPAGNLLQLPASSIYQGHALPAPAHQGPLTPLVRMASSQSSQYMPLEGYTGSQSWPDPPSSTSGGRRSRGRSLIRRQFQPAAPARALPERTQQALESAQRSGALTSEQQGLQSSLPPIAQSQYLYAATQEAPEITAITTSAFQSRSSFEALQRRGLSPGRGRGQYTQGSLQPLQGSVEKPDTASQQQTGPQRDLETLQGQAGSYTQDPSSGGL